MWILNTDTNQWIKQTDVLSKDNYDNLKQDLSQLKLYSKALDGSNYLAIHDVENIYEPITYKDTKSWYINPAASVYNTVGDIPYNGVSIDKNSLPTYNNYNSEYGFTLKNSFTPEKAISDINFIEIDIATTNPIIINSGTLSTIDGIKLIEGQQILIKDQISTIDLSFTVDPTTYFKGNYYLISDNVSDSTYYYYSSDNGIYTYTNGKLIKSTFSNYDSYKGLTVYVKLGYTNVNKQFHLSRLISGYYPTEGDPIEFTENHNYLVRHQVDYHDLFENNYFDVLKHATQSYYYQGITYTIPERLLYIGDFGVLLISQSGTYSQYIYNDFKDNLRALTQTSGYYWACGENGVLLKISKIDLSIIKIDLGEEFNTLTSISFIDDQTGILVGKYNTIYSTFNGGYNWNKISFEGITAYSYNRVMYYSYTNVYIAGENGVFMELNYSSSTGWSLTQRNIIKYLSTTDEYELIEDINDIFYTSFTASWDLNYSGLTGLGIINPKECLFLVTNNSNIIIYEINNFVPEFDFIYLSFTQSIGDITSITQQANTNNIVVSANEVILFDISTFDYVTTTSNLIISNTYSVLYASYNNRIFDYEGTTLYNVGNMALIGDYTYPNPYAPFWSNNDGLTYSYFCYPASTADSVVYPIGAIVVYNYNVYQSLVSSNNDNLPDISPVEWGNIGYLPSDLISISTETVTPKMLFMDYDMANKLNFFDSNYNYRLPVSITFSSVGTISSIKFNSSTSTWLDYLIDSYKTYAVNSNTTTDYPVLLSTTFSYYGTSSLTFSNSVISLTYSDIQNLYPTVGSYTQSKFTQFTPSAPGNSYKILLYRYAAILYLTSDFCSVGDTLRLTCPTIDTTFMVNKTYQPVVPGSILTSNLSKGGSGYFIGETFSINGGTPQAIGTVLAIGTASAGGLGLTTRVNAVDGSGAVISAAEPGISGTLGGSGYSVGEVVEINGGAPNKPCQLLIQSVNGAGSVIAWSIINGGLGYSVTGTTVSTTMLSILTGVVTTYQLLMPGGSYSLGTNSAISSTGSGLIINIISVATSSNSMYFYAFHDMNQAMLNAINDSPSITITNLNKYSDNVYYSDLLTNFSIHPISNGYDLSYNNSIFEVDSRFNNLTAYKSLETNLNVNYISSTASFNMLYEITYNQFGYTPTYNILNYLSNISSSFTASKKFYSMPEYSNLPGNNAGGFTPNNIYYDSNSSTTWLKNKLVFGVNLFFEWSTLWLNTFVDITLITQAGTYTKTQILITKKYYDSVIGGYAIEFNKKILDITNTAVLYIDILSRNTLGQISSDLELFNEINKPLINKNYVDGTFKYFNFYDNPIKTKLNTDSYTKILLSDGDIKNNLSSIIYTDADSKLVMNVININTTQNISVNNTFEYGSKLALNTLTTNNINSQFAYINFYGGTGSSQQLNSNYIGVHILTPIDEYNILTDISYGNTPTVQDIGTITLNIFDPFFNYQPINLIDIGVDSMYKIPVTLSEINISKMGLSVSIINFEQNNPIFRLIDGLDINLVSQNYHWILEAEISDGIIGLDNNGIVWYSGNWLSGRWFGGTWYSGNWISGDWYDGTWSSVQIIDKINTVSVGKSSVSNLNSVWYNGRWFNGTWNSGTWQNGRRYAGIWYQGDWYNGVWNDGIWYNGTFNGGVWVQGMWYSGIFNSSNKPSYWINGKFYSGDFQNGMWYNGQFGQNYNVISKFGSAASNSRNATWHGGIFSSGNFYSKQNIDSNGNDILSEVHKYSIWKTGIFNQGNFYGGIVYNIDFQNGTWYGGITQDIEIIGISNPTYSNQITLNGVFRFNIGDYINIINNGTSTPYYNLGNYDNPGRYRVANVDFDLDNEWTILTIDYNFNSLSFTSPYNATASNDIDTGLRSVSKFKYINWKSGIWGNGIFEGGTFEGGIWYDGVFAGNWGI